MILQCERFPNIIQMPSKCQIGFDFISNRAVSLLARLGSIFIRLNVVLIHSMGYLKFVYLIIKIHE